MALSVDTILERYRVLLDEALSRRDEPWFSASIMPERYEGGKFVELTAEVLDRFNNFYIGGIGLEAADYGISTEEHADIAQFAPLAQPSPERILTIERTARYTGLTELRNTVEATPNDVKLWLQAASDQVDSGGHRTILSVHRKLFLMTNHSARLARRIVAIKNGVGWPETPVTSVLELGGGHGKTTIDMVGLFNPKITYYVDLPLNMALAARYAELFRPNLAHLVWSEEDEPQPGKFNLVAPWLLHKIKEPVDLMVNFLSLHHMAGATQEHYFANLIEPKVRQLYHENRLHPRDNYEGALATSSIREKMQLLSSREVFKPEFYTGKLGNLMESSDLWVYGELIRNPRFG